MKKLWLSILSLLIICFAQAQIGKILKGTVSYESGGKMNPLAGATILEEGTAHIATSDESGSFTLILKKNKSAVTINMIGYASQHISVGDSTILNIVMKPAEDNVNEVVVTAMGIKREARSLGYSVQTANSKDLNMNHQSNVVNALQGKVAGVQITSGGGGPGQGASILIRGINSIDPNRNNQPLFVIDGVEMDNSTYNIGDGTGTRGMTNRGADINPDDIASISILKSGPATALYGIRAANGAIIITTKSGQKGRLTVSYNGMFSSDHINKRPDVQSKYTQGWKGVYDTTSFWPNFGPTLEAARAIDPSVPSSLYNNYKRAFRNGNQMRHTVSVSGGSDKSQLFASMSYFDQQGVMYFSDYKSYNGRIGGEFTISPKIKAGASLNFVNSGGNRPNYDRFGENLIYWANRWDVLDYIKPDGTMKTNPSLANNPIYVAATNKFKDNVNRTIASAHVSYAPTNWLNFMYRFGNDFFDDSRTATAPGPLGVPGEVTELDDNGYGFIGNYNTKNRIITSTFLADFNKNFNNGSTIDFKLGYDLRDQKLRQFSVYGDTLIVPDFFALQNAKKVTGSTYAMDSRIYGFFGDLSFGYKDFLYLDVTGRNDHSSNLAPQRRSYFYPSASLSYVFSENIKLPSWWSYGKLKASYAKIGKDGSAFAITNGFFANGPIGNTIPYQQSTTAGNYELKPEFTTTTEIGTELRFLNNRLGLQVNGYWANSKDLIAPISVSNATGYDNVYKNVGQIKNSGIEVTVNAKPVMTKDFTWDFMINFSKNTNEVVKLNDGLNEVILASQYGYSSSSVTNKLIPGLPSGALYGRSYKRYYGTQTDDGSFRKDLPVLIGANGFPVVDTKQRYLANSSPTWMGNTTQNFRYKNFNLSFLIDIRQGQYRYNQLSNFLASFGQMKFQENADQTIVFDGVTADGSKNTKAVYLGQGVGSDGVNYGNGFYRNVYRGSSENFIENASWVRLRTVSLGYSLPKELLSKTKVFSAATISLVGNNLWLNTKWKGWDPESSSMPSGSNSANAFAGFVYPGTKNFMVNLNIQF